MFNSIKIFIILALFSSFCVAGENNDDFNIDKLSVQATKENKVVMIYFHMKYCPYCKRMNKKTINAKNIKKQLSKYFIVPDININNNGIITHKNFQGSKKDFAKKLGISLYPTVVFIDNNNVVYKVRGYRNKNKFVEILKFITSKSYKEMDFEDFLVELELNSNE